MGCPKIVPKGNLSEMVSNWQISIRYEDNQIMTVWLAGMLASGLSGLARRFAGLAEWVAGRLARFAGRVAVFDKGLTRYAGFARFSP